MKKYSSPIFEIKEIDSCDIITTSPGTDTPAVDVGGSGSDSEGGWDW